MYLWKFAPASRGFEGFQRLLKYSGCCISIFDTLDNVSKTSSFALDCPFWVFTLEPHFFFFFHSSSFFLSFHHAFKNSKFVQNRWKIQKNNLGKRKVAKALLIFNFPRNKLSSLSIYVWSKWTFKVRNVG